MKGGTAYHLTLWLQENDPRGFQQLAIELPRYYSRRIYERLRGWHDTPWRFVWSEISGYLAGFWGYWQSCQRVKRQGRSAPYKFACEPLQKVVKASDLSKLEQLVQTASVGSQE
jgi:hypothetical protein